MLVVVEEIGSLFLGVEPFGFFPGGHSVRVVLGKVDYLHSCAAACAVSVSSSGWGEVPRDGVPDFRPGFFR